MRMVFKNPFLDDDSLTEDEYSLDHALGIDSSGWQENTGDSAGKSLPSLDDLGGDSGENSTSLSFDEDDWSGEENTPIESNRDLVVDDSDDDWDRGYIHDDTEEDSDSGDDLDVLDDVDLDELSMLIDAKKASPEVEDEDVSDFGGWDESPGDGGWDFEEIPDDDDNSYSDPELFNDDNGEEDEQFDDSSTEKYTPPDGDLFAGATSSRITPSGVEQLDNDDSSEEEPSSNNAVEESGLKGTISGLKSKFLEIVNSVKSELKGEDNDAKKSDNATTSPDERDGSRKDSKKGEEKNEQSRLPVIGVLSQVTGLYGKLTSVIAGFILRVLSWVAKIPGMETRVLRITLTTRIVPTIANMIPILVLVSVLGAFSYLSVERETTSELPDSGSVAMSKFSYSNGGTALGVVQNTSDVSVEPVVDFTVYSIKPSLNPKTWFMYQKDLTCQSDPISLDIGEKKEASAPCGQVSGWLPRVSGTAE